MFLYQRDARLVFSLCVCTAGIRNMLNQAITTEHVIHPSMGTVEFFEYQLTNPNNSEASISIRVDCSEVT